MDKADRAVTLARVQKWVLIGLLVAPADLALDVLLLCIFDNAAVYLNSLFLVEVVIAINVVGVLVHIAAVGLLDRRASGSTFFNVQVGRHQSRSEVLDGKLEPSELDGVSLAQLVICDVLLRGLHVPHNDKHHVGGICLGSALSIGAVVLVSIQSVIFYDELAVFVLGNRNQGLGLSVVLFRLQLSR